MQAAPSALPTSISAIIKFNEYHALAANLPNGSAAFHKGACIFFSGLMAHQANGICGDLKDLEEKIQILKDKQIRYCIFANADAVLKTSGFLAKVFYEAFWMPLRTQIVTLDQTHSVARVDADNFIKWNEFCTRANKDKSYKSMRLNFFQQIIISKMPISHWIYKVNDLIVAALSIIALKDTLMILNTSVENLDAYRKLAQTAINSEEGRHLKFVITYLTPSELKLPDSTSIWSYHLYFMM